MLSIASPWSFPASLFSIHRTQSVLPFAQFNPLTVPPREAERLAKAFPSRAPAVAVAIGEVKLKPEPAAVQLVTPMKEEPNPYSRTML